MRHLVTIIEELKKRGIGFRSVCDGVIDTTTPSGELSFHVFSALAQFERRLIQERTEASLAAARARGRKGCRPPLNPIAPRVVLAQKLFRDKRLRQNPVVGELRA
jgi:DNA invertase Pin-like site-specific DNA recombinase